MNSDRIATSFGRALVETTSPQEIARLEVDHGKNERFAFLDSVVDYLLYEVLRGERILSVTASRSAPDRVVINGLTDEVVAELEASFSVPQQQARGAWYLPDDVTLRVGLAELPALFSIDPRFGLGVAWEKKASVRLGDSGAVVMYWSLFEPFLESLFRPLELRSRQSGALDRDKQLAAWSEIDAVCAAIGLQVDEELAVMRYGAGWSRFRADEQVASRKRFLDALATQVGVGVSAGYRAYRVDELVRKYYQRARKGPATRQKTLTRRLERTLSALFSGDWLAFLDYIDEAPDPSEEITTAVPATRLIVGPTRSAADVASERGVPVEEVRRALSTYWQSPDGVPAEASPVRRRVEVLARYWALFEEIHTKQTSGMPSLWGLVEDGATLGLGWPGPQWHDALLYRQLLPADLLADIEELWDTIMLPRWPDRVVTEIFPHALMARALGPALNFWHGCALTAWFLCEGPYSRTDIAGMPQYYERDLAALAEIGCPVDDALFDRLGAAERRLGPPQELAENMGTTESVSGFSISMSFVRGHRREGFEILRQVIDAARQAWTAQHIDSYLRARWESELTEASREYAETVADRGRPPTAKQFAKHAASSVNHWLGGDFSALYAVMGEKSPVRPTRSGLIPHDRRALAARVFDLLGGRPFQREVVVEDRAHHEAQVVEQQRHQQIAGLAEYSLRYVQLQEAMGRPPTMKDVGRNFEYRAGVLDENVERAWEQYTAAIAQALRELQSTSN